MVENIEGLTLIYGHENESLYGFGKGSVICALMYMFRNVLMSFAIDQSHLSIIMRHALDFYL